MSDEQNRFPAAVGAETGRDSNTEAETTVDESSDESPLDERFKYRIRFLVEGHRHDELFLSLDDAREFAAKYVVEHGLRVRDLRIIDSLSNVREWRAMSKKTLKLSKPRLHLSPAGVVLLYRYLEIVPKVDIDNVVVGEDGRVFIPDPTPEWPTRHRVVGKVDNMLQDFVARWNEGVRAFAEAHTVGDTGANHPTATQVT
jgi:hypothetical protein